MKFLIVFVALIAVALAAPGYGSQCGHGQGGHGGLSQQGYGHGGHSQQGLNQDGHTLELILVHSGHLQKGYDQGSHSQQGHAHHGY